MRRCVFGKDPCYLTLISYLGEADYLLWWSSLTKTCKQNPKKRFSGLVWLNRRRVPRSFVPASELIKELVSSQSHGVLVKFYVSACHTDTLQRRAEFCASCCVTFVGSLSAQVSLNTDRDLLDKK